MKIQRREFTSKTAQGFLQVAGSLIGSERVQTVDARTLWRWLGVGRDFSNWIKSRIEECQFEEGKDFIKQLIDFIDAKTGERKVNKIEYHITLDMAKHLAMLERNPRGKEAREYFIQCEHDLLSLKDQISKTKKSLIDLENEMLSLQGFKQLSLKERKNQRSQIWEIWRKTNATSPELNYRRIQVAKEVNLIINGITSYRFRQLTQAGGLARDWMPLENQYCFYLAETDLLWVLREHDFNVNFSFIERVYPQLARVAKERVELMYGIQLSINIEEVIQGILNNVRQQAASNITPYVQTEEQIIEFQRNLQYEVECLEQQLSAKHRI